MRKLKYSKKGLKIAKFDIEYILLTLVSILAFLIRGMHTAYQRFDAKQRGIANSTLEGLRYYP